MSNFRLIVNTQDIYNQELFDIYMKNFSNDLIFNPFFRYFNIIDIYLWFTLVNSNNEIIGECSIEEISDKDSYIKTFEFHDVFIQEKFRGNNYAELMILSYGVLKKIYIMILSIEYILINILDYLILLPII